MKKNLYIPLSLILLSLTAIAGIFWYTLKITKLQNTNQQISNIHTSTEIKDNTTPEQIHITSDIEEFSEEDLEEIDTSNWQTYRNEEYGFEFRYPFSMIVRDIGSVDPISGIPGSNNTLIVCFYDNSDDICETYGKVFVKLRNDLVGINSFQATQVIYEEYQTERKNYNLSDPRLLGIREYDTSISSYFMASYFGGDSISYEVYIPISTGLLVYSYDVAPEDNDPRNKIHKQVANSILVTLIKSLSN